LTAHTVHTTTFNTINFESRTDPLSLLI